MYQFFRIASRSIIIVPLVIILIALIFRFNGSLKNSFQKKTSSPTPTTAKIGTDILKMFTAASGEAKLNLTDSFVCQFKDKTSSISAQIQDRKMFAHVESEGEIKNIVMRDDCVHIWESGSFSGERFCGIGPYLSMAEQFLSMGLMSFGTMIDSLSSFAGGKSLPLSDETIQKLVNSCKKNDALDRSLFEIPQNVLFKNTKTP